MYRAGDNFYNEFVTTNVSGAIANADTTPLAHLFVNGVDDFGVTVFVTNVDLGRYVCSGTIPSTYLQGWSVGIVASGNVGQLTQKAAFNLGPIAVGDWTTTEKSQIRYKLGIDGTAVIPTSGYGHMELSASGTELVMVESNVNMRQALTIGAAAFAGVSSGTGDTIFYDGINKATQLRISAVAISGIRSSVTLTLP